MKHILRASGAAAAVFEPNDPEYAFRCACLLVVVAVWLWMTQPRAVLSALSLCVPDLPVAGYCAGPGPWIAVAVYVRYFDVDRAKGSPTTAS
jgi:hypothetical protein